MKVKSLQKKLGQNTAEYMLLLLLVGGGSIVAFKYFGAGVINRFSSIVSIMTGGTEEEFNKEDHKPDSENVDFNTFDDQGSEEGGAAPAP